MSKDICDSRDSTPARNRRSAYDSLHTVIDTKDRLAPMVVHTIGLGREKKKKIDHECEVEKRGDT